MAYREPAPKPDPIEIRYGLPLGAHLATQWMFLLLSVPTLLSGVALIVVGLRHGEDGTFLWACGIPFSLLPIGYLFGVALGHLRAPKIRIHGTEVVRRSGWPVATDFSLGDASEAEEVVIQTRREVRPGQAHLPDHEQLKDYITEVKLGSLVVSELMNAASAARPRAEVIGRYLDIRVREAQ